MSRISKTSGKLCIFGETLKLKGENRKSSKILLRNVALGRYVSSGYKQVADN